MYVQYCMAYTVSFALKTPPKQRISGLGDLDRAIFVLLLLVHMASFTLIL